MPTLVKNKRVRFDYTVIDDYEAGIVLTGAEVKSCKLGQVSLEGAYVSIEKTQLWLKNMRITPYQMGNQRDYDPMRNRKLLLHNKEIDKLIGKMKRAGLTLLPESLYTTRGFVKAKLVLAKGKKKADKRATIKKREADRSIGRALRQKV